MSDKGHLRGQLQTIKNNNALVQLAGALATEPDAPERFEKSVASLGEHPEIKTFAYITYVFDRDDLLKHAISQFRNSVLRNCLKETFELVKAYGKCTNQDEMLRTAEWYPFLRIVRNCLSHDFMLRFRKHDLKQLPVTWAGLTIDGSMNNQPLPMNGFLSRPKVIELLDDVIEYVESNVS